MGVSKNRGGKTPKMDGENKGKPIKMDDLGVPLFLETPTLQPFNSCLFVMVWLELCAVQAWTKHPASISITIK